MMKISRKIPVNLKKGRISFGKSWAEEQEDTAFEKDWKLDMLDHLKSACHDMKEQMNSWLEDIDNSIVVLTEGEKDYIKDYEMMLADEEFTGDDIEHMKDELRFFAAALYFSDLKNNSITWTKKFKAR